MVDLYGQCTPTYMYNVWIRLYNLPHGSKAIVEYKICMV